MGLRQRRAPASARSSITRETAGIRGEYPEHARLGAQHRDICGAVTAQDDCEGQVQQDLRWIVDRARSSPGPTPADNARSRPHTRAVSANNTLPAGEIIDSPLTTAGSHGRHWVRSTCGVPFCSGCDVVANARFPYRTGACLSVMIRGDARDSLNQPTHAFGPPPRAYTDSGTPWTTPTNSTATC